MNTVACAVCGADIQLKRHGSHRRYCDLRCKRRAQEIRRPRRQPYVESHCRHCDAVLPPPHPHGGGPREYCDPKCRDAARRGARKPAHRHCEYCNEPIEGIATKRFCSNRCRKRARRGAAAGEQPCALCGKPLPPKRRKFCDNGCLRLSRQGPKQKAEARAAEKIRRERRAEAERQRKAEAKAERERLKHLKPSPQELLVMRVGWPGARKAA